MSGSSRSRQKRKLEPISIEELAGTTGMSGFCSFLTRDNSVSVPALDKVSGPESSAPDLGAVKSDLSDSGAPITDASEVSAAVMPAVEAPAVEIHWPETDAPVTIRSGAPESPSSDSSASDSDALVETGALDYVYRRRVRIREAVTVQDAHSLAEQAVYDAMYRAGKPYQGDSRILTIGLRTLADLSRMAYSNCKANVRSLVAKLAIEERDGFSYTDGRTYVIYSFREILRRRKSAGLTHVIRNRGVAFVDPLSGKSLRDSSAPESGAIKSPAPASRSGALEPEGTGALSIDQSSAPAPVTHIRNSHSIRKESKESSSFLAPLVAALRHFVPDIDDDAAWELWNRCRENAPGAKIQEVMHFIELKAGKPGIRMPIGFLLTAVPKCFLGDSYRQFQMERQRSQEAARQRERSFAEEILRSPDADEEQKEWAREVLNAS